jgi:hypothetical protein
VPLVEVAVIPRAAGGLKARARQQGNWVTIAAVKKKKYRMNLKNLYERKF